VVERESDAVDLLVCPINEARDSKVVRLVYGTRPGDGMEHRPSDNVWVNDAQIKIWVAVFHELPCHGFGTSLGDVVAENGIIPLDCLLGCDLELC